MFVRPSRLIMYSVFLGLMGLQSSLRASAEPSSKVPNTAIPMTCYGEGHGSEMNAGPQQFKCYNQDISKAIDSKKLVYRNMCMYVNGHWGIGTLTKPKNTSIKSISADNFKEKFPCTYGIEVAVKQTDSLQAIGPSVNEIIGSCQSADKACLNNIDSSKLANFEGLSEGKMISTCFTRQVAGGEPGSSVSCVQSPSKANFCAYEDVSLNPKLPADDRAKYKGKWFVIYLNPGKKTPRICKGGVYVSDATSDSVEEKIVYSGSVSGDQNYTKGTVSFTPVNYTAPKKFSSGTPLYVVGCESISSKGKPLYRICQNAGGCDMNDQVKGQCANSSFENTKSKDKEKTCFYAGSNWHYYEKYNKKTPTTLICSKVDVITEPREDVDSMKEDQSNPNIQAVHDTNNNSEVRIGASVDAGNRPLKVMGKDAAELVGIGANALSSVCSSAGCSFKVSGVKASQAVGILRVDGGSEFTDNALFGKDVIISKNLQINETLNVSDNISAKTINATSVSTTSDKRLKKGVVSMSNILAKIMNVRSVYYSYDEEQFNLLRPEFVEYLNNNPSEKERFFNKQHVGFIAQELEQVFPQVVVTDTKNENQIKSVSYGELSSVALQGVKELYIELLQMKKEIKQLQDENKKLKANLNKKK